MSQAVLHAHTVKRSSSLMMLFHNRKIASKIAIGFTLVLVITAAISVMAYSSFMKVEHGFETFNQRVTVVGIARELDREFLAFRRFVREYAVTGNEDDVAAANKGREILKVAIGKGLAEIKNPERAAKMKHIAEQFEGYSKGFDKLIVLRREQIKMISEVLDPTGLRLRNDIEQLQTWAVGKAGNSNTMILAGEALKQLLLARLNVNKLLGRHDESAAQGADKAFADLKVAMTGFAAAANNPEVRKLFDEVNANVEKYNQAYKKASQDAHEIDGLVNGEMKKMAEAIAADAQAIKEAGISEEKKIEEEFISTIGLTEQFIMLFAVGGLVLGGVLAWLIGRVISKPVVALVPLLKKLSDGDFNVTLPGLGRKDEIGHISEAAEMIVERFGDTISGVKRSVGEVSNASAEISSSTTDLSQRTEEQAASLEEVSASMEEMTATVRKNAENAKEANELATSTRSVADRGGQVVAETVEAMAKIEESSRKISDIIGVIDEIARQTNLLALNAAVEAARAGEAGRGFAVVASEVRSLAQRSSQAAKDIKELITNSTAQVKQGVDLVNRAGTALNEIVVSIRKVNEVVSDIANASNEQSTGLDQISKALAQMDEVTQQNSALVEENAATARTLEEQARALAADQRIAFFKPRGSAQSEGAPQAPVPAHANEHAPEAQHVAKIVPAPQPKAHATVARPAIMPGPARRMQTALATAYKLEPEETF
ncbi:MAG: methyl-accepting chemotaxis protein [Pseudomonadota bacterium]